MWSMTRRHILPASWRARCQAQRSWHAAVQSVVLSPRWGRSGVHLNRCFRSSSKASGPAQMAKEKHIPLGRWLVAWLVRCEVKSLWDSVDQWLSDEFSCNMVCNMVLGRLAGCTPVQASPALVEGGSGDIKKGDGRRRDPPASQLWWTWQRGVAPSAAI